MPIVSEERLMQKATETYEKARDEDKRLAILTIARALLDAWGEGADSVYQSMKEQRDTADARR